MRSYGNYDRRYDYQRRTRDRDMDRDNYGARRRDSRGRYMGDDVMEEMYNRYHDYTEGRDSYSRGNYGAKDDTIESLECMLEAIVDFVEVLKQEANSQEEIEIVQKYLRKISEI